MVEAATHHTLAALGEETLSLLSIVEKNDKIKGSETEKWPRESFLAEAERFQLWAVNLGLFVRGHGSLDYRLREAESLESTIRRFITGLNESLVEVVQYFGGGLAEEDSASRPFSEFISVNDEQESDKDESDFEVLLGSIKDPIDRLFKISTRIRNPSTRLRSSKAIRYQQVDEESGVDFLEAIQKFDKDYVSSLFLQYRKSKVLEELETVEPPGDIAEKDVANNVWEPIQTVLSQYKESLEGTESFLVSRIAQANVERRKQFGYWKKHRNKLSQHAKGITIDFGEGREGSKQTVVIPENQKDKLPTPSVTTASRLNVPHPIYHDNRSAVSVSEYAPSMWKPGEEVVDFPPAPKHDTEESFFECPYCFTLCSTKILSGKAWKAHLIHDLRPYICTYETCRNHLQLYDSRQEWIQHENSHRMLWRCPQHLSHVSHTLDEFREHLICEKHYDGDFDASTGLTLAAETTRPSSDRCCPICSLQLETGPALHNHIALHLERFSLFALPRSVDHKEDDSGKVESNQANSGFDGSRDDKFDLSSNDPADGIEVQMRLKSAIRKVIILNNVIRWWRRTDGPTRLVNLHRPQIQPRGFLNSFLGGLPEDRPSSQLPIVSPSQGKKDTTSMLENPSGSHKTATSENEPFHVLENASSTATATISFLFIVNELPTNDDPDHPGSIRARYVDGRWRPPRKIRGFFQQQPGWVYRWSDGVVSVAQNYIWSSEYTIRGTADGRIFDPVNYIFPEYYRAATMFYCNRFDLFFSARGDASIKDMDQCDSEDDWHPLTFSHDHNITRLEHVGQEVHVDVRAASWIDQLVPNVYRKSSSTHDSSHKGLGGLLPLAISLIAFSCENREELHRILMDEAWYGRTWRSHGRTTGRIPQRGMVTTVYLDPENPQGSTSDALFDLEYGKTPLFR